ncbi:MAG: OmpH family outer membrane protein [Akkermansiaceae bacterium]|nr:OmpH family outer membrane protein [Akkermansiaceae bacterium]
MKRFITSLSALAVAFAAVAATAQAEIKVATVNMTELNIMYYMRAEAAQRISKEVADAQQELAARREKVKAIEDEIVQSQKQLDPTLSEAAQDKLRKKIIAIRNEYEAAQDDLKVFAQRVQASVSELERRENYLISKDLHEAVAAVASEGGYDLVLDVTAGTPAGYRVVPFAKPELDITMAVIKRLNADAPADFDPQAEMQRYRAALPSAAPTQQQAPQK